MRSRRECGIGTMSLASSLRVGRKMLDRSRGSRRKLSSDSSSTPSTPCRRRSKLETQPGSPSAELLSPGRDADAANDAEILAAAYETRFLRQMRERYGREPSEAELRPGTAGTNSAAGLSLVSMVTSRLRTPSGGGDRRSKPSTSFCGVRRSGENHPAVYAKAAAPTIAVGRHARPRRETSGVASRRAARGKPHPS
jgi:hypothetical protein